MEELRRRYETLPDYDVALIHAGGRDGLASDEAWELIDLEYARRSLAGSAAEELVRSERAADQRRKAAAANPLLSETPLLQGAIDSPFSLRAAAIVCVTVAAILRAAGSGWFLLLFWWSYLGVLLLHTVVHWRLSPRVSGYAEAVRATFFSHGALLLAMLLQFDADDAAGEFLVATKILGTGYRPPWPSGLPPITAINFLLFVPIVRSWFRVAKLAARDDRKRPPFKPPRRLTSA